MEKENMMIETLELNGYVAPAPRVNVLRPEDVAGVREVNARDYKIWLERLHPRLYSLLDQRIINDPDTWARHFAGLGAVAGHQEFADAPEKGRGRAYRERQKKYPLARATGYRTIFKLLKEGMCGMSPKTVLVDLLGGNGTLVRAMRNLVPLTEHAYFITSDVNEFMIHDAMLQGIPALRQAAQRTLFANSQIDAAFYGYGLHHVAPADRPEMVLEAYRILKPGGLIMLHDFEEGSPTARWYSEGLDSYTDTGHKFVHFTGEVYRELLEQAGFNSISIFPMYDPFVFVGPTAVGVRYELLNHLVEMFGMVKIARTPEESESEFCDRVEAVFAPFSTFDAGDVAFEPKALRRFVVYQEAPGVWHAEYPRIALMATAHKA